jgi:hypothetical protein
MAFEGPESNAQIHAARSIKAANGYFLSETQVNNNLLGCKSNCRARHCEPAG